MYDELIEPFFELYSLVNFRTCDCKKIEGLIPMCYLL